MNIYFLQEKTKIDSDSNLCVKCCSAHYTSMLECLSKMPFLVVAPCMDKMSNMSSVTFLLESFSHMKIASCAVSVESILLSTAREFATKFFAFFDHWPSHKIDKQTYFC